MVLLPPSVEKSHPTSVDPVSPYQRLINVLGQQALIINSYISFCQVVVQAIAETFAVDYVRIWEVVSDRHSLRLVTNYGFSPEGLINYINVDSYPSLHEILSTDQPILSKQINHSGDDYPTPPPAGSSCGLILPILAESQIALGILEIYSKIERSFTLDEIHCLQAVSQLLTTVVERERVSYLEQTQSQIFQAVAVGENIYAIYNDLCLLLEQILPKAYCFILTRDPQENRLRAGAAPTLPTKFAQGVDGLIIAEGAASCGTAAYRGESVFVNDIANDPLWANLKDLALNENIRACWSSPFLSKTGEVLGTFAIAHSVACEATLQHLDILKTATHLASIATENARYTTALEKEIKEKNQALEELKQVQTQLIQSEKLSSLGELVARVAHEINNPIGCITGNLKPAQDYIQDLFDLISLYQREYPQASGTIQSALENCDFEFIQEDLPKILQSMADSTQRIYEISRSMRTFVRSDSDKKVAFNLHYGLDSTLLILKHRLQNQDNLPEIQVVKEYGNIPIFNCFPGQLNQVFMNLLANAIDAIESAGFQRQHQITVKTALTNNENAIMVTIQDTGMGMSDEVKSHLFEYLYTTKDVGKGTGLGLSIAREIVEEKHNGQLTCTSTLGEGTTFMILLPINPPESSY
ncbi:GAF domain-containing protein [Sphaerospermopsis aphanizomenoides BCCUSP55]|uniref:GAF domain-containing sensor histidine kinase n=1 Tax=Sphaerospermopsis aphanizomenoides TaxID=459663 RepID=UPI001904204C|nr:ATP-binding protein [Sphaerospermopsis aphanizomenoides]MBK1986336.1 GAF domain-containing protein [Sphaerospermopsis aphanizomenoides BCCUSP55]